MENLIGIIVYVVSMALNITIIECMFGYNEFLVIASIFSVVCLMPGAGKIKERGQRYEFVCAGTFQKKRIKKDDTFQIKGKLLLRMCVAAVVCYKCIISFILCIYIVSTGKDVCSGNRLDIGNVIYSSGSCLVFLLFLLSEMLQKCISLYRGKEWNMAAIQ